MTDLVSELEKDEKLILQETIDTLLNDYEWCVKVGLKFKFSYFSLSN